MTRGSRSAVPSTILVRRFDQYTGSGSGYPRLVEFNTAVRERRKLILHGVERLERKEWTNFLRGFTVSVTDPRFDQGRDGGSTTR